MRELWSPCSIQASSEVALHPEVFYPKPRRLCGMREYAYLVLLYGCSPDTPTND